MIERWLKTVCVFCGSQSGRGGAYEHGARAFGAALAARNIGLIYGGGRVGLMGTLAQTVLDNGGEVVGIIPGFLNNPQVMHTGLTACHVVGDLFERKALMLELADAFVALPGGLGTADELLEVITWKQLGQLHKPVALLNVEAYFDCWVAAAEHTIAMGFTQRAHVCDIILESDPDELLRRLAAAAGRAGRGAR